MAKSIKLKDEIYLDSTSISHNRKILSDILYPIGSIYLSINDVDPSTIFGGAWEQIKDTFLLACGENYKAGSVGGEATHTLTEDEMPSHNHNINYDQIWSYGGTTSIGVTNGGPYPGAGYVRNAGGGKEHNNMPPYIAIYVWKRIS